MLFAFYFFCHYRIFFIINYKIFFSFEMYLLKKSMMKLYSVCCLSFNSVLSYNASGIPDYLIWPNQMYLFVYLFALVICTFVLLCKKSVFY